MVRAEKKKAAIAANLHSEIFNLKFALPNYRRRRRERHFRLLAAARSLSLTSGLERARRSRLRVQHVAVVRTQAELNQCARVGQNLGLPALLCLEAAHRFLRAVIPNAIGVAREVVLADQGFLDLAGPVRRNRLLTFRLPGLLGRGLVLGFARLRGRRILRAGRFGSAGLGAAFAGRGHCRA